MSHDAVLLKDLLEDLNSVLFMIPANEQIQ